MYIKIFKDILKNRSFGYIFRPYLLNFMEKIKNKDNFWWYELKQLWNAFDPIGVYIEPSECPDDEYDSYIVPTFELLEKQADFDKLYAYISSTVNDHMGMDAVSDKYITDFVRKLQAWYVFYRNKCFFLKKNDIKELSIAAYVYLYGQPPIENGIIDLHGKNLTSLDGLDLLVDLSQREYVSCIYLDDNFLGLSWFNSDPMRVCPFSYFTKLKFIDLSHNYITELPANLFENLPVLKFLDLSHNHITGLPANLFESLTSLQELYLYLNDLEYLKPDDFKGLCNVHSLDLSVNKLKELPAQLFNYTINLTYLDLTNNKLNNLDAALFDKLVHLEDLFLMLNKIEVLDHGIFKNLVVLKKLYLSFNPLRTIPIDVFKNLKNLELLQLDDEVHMLLKPEHLEGLIKLKPYIDQVLIEAAQNGEVETVKILLENGADIHAKNEIGRTALMYAVGNLNHHLDLVPLLLEKGSDIHIKDNDGCSALFYAARYGRMDDFELLLEKGADIEELIKKDSRVLIRAVRWGRIDLVELLLEHGVEVNVTDDDGYTALMVAAKSGNLDLVALLLEHDADINAKNWRGTALIWVIPGGNLDMILFLLQHGADVNAQDKWGFTALMHASRTGNKDIVKLLSDNKEI